MRAILAALACFALVACAQATKRGDDAPRRIVSLDYCADQYVLRFVEREDILALSPHAERQFSFMRAEAKGIRQVRPRASDILALEPDVVVRNYGGGPNITAFLERAGVQVVQLGFPNSLAEVRDQILRIGSELGQSAKAEAVVDEMDRRLTAIASQGSEELEVLYMAPAGVTTGEGSLVHELILAAGLKNFQDRPGWNPLPLERLAYERPDIVAAGFFDSKTNHEDNWSASRHPVARAQLQELPVVPIDGAWTACGGWFQVEAVEALAKAKSIRQ